MACPMFDLLRPDRYVALALDTATGNNRVFRAYREGPNVRLVEPGVAFQSVVSPQDFAAMLPRPISFVER